MTLYEPKFKRRGSKIILKQIGSIIFRFSSKKGWKCILFEEKLTIFMFVAFTVFVVFTVFVAEFIYLFGLYAKNWVEIYFV